MNQQTGAGGEGMARQKKPAEDPQQIQFSIDDMIDPQPVDTKAAIASFSDTVQKTKEAIEAAAAPQLENLAAAGADAIKESFSVTQEELQRLMELPLSQIEALPKEKQEIVWQEIARQMTELPEFETAAANFAKMLQSAHDAATAITDSFAKTLQGTMLSWDGIAQSMADAAKAAESAWQGIIESSKCFDTEALHTMTVLSPYIDKEYKANKAKYEHAEFSELIAAAAALARADGIEIPPLKAEEAQQAQKTEETQQAQEDTANKEDIPAEPAPIAKARDAGAITSLNGHIAIIADKVLQNCFTSKDIKALPGAAENYLFDADTGKLNMLSLNGEPLQELDEMHTGFQMALLQIAALSDLREYNSKTNALIGIYLPAFFRETGIDPRPRKWDKTTGALIARTKPTEQELKYLRYQRFVEFMQPLDNRVGVIKGEGVYRDATFQSFDEKTEIAYITTPYSFKLAELARLHSDRHSAISNIFRANILTENQTAVELANRIAIGLIERGVTLADIGTYRAAKRKPIKKSITTTTADGKKTTVTETFAPDAEPAVQEKPKRQFTYRVRFDSLIAACPQLQRELSEIRNSDKKNKSQFINKKLKDIFTAAVKIIMEKSEVPHYYKDLTITTEKFDTFKAPTNSTLTGYLLITHKGKNPDFAS